MTLRTLLLCCGFIAAAPAPRAAAQTAPAAAPADAVFQYPADAARFANDLREAVSALKGAKTLRGLYTQDKKLQGVSRTLKAEGNFLFVRDLGIAWLTTVPFESELVITETDVIQRENGQVTMQVSAADQPAVRVVGQIFAAVFALDFERLSEHFELYSRRVGRGWELGLRPREAGGLKQVIVRGGRQVERVLVLDSNLDATDIRLKGTAMSSALPPAEELRRFKP